MSNYSLGSAFRGSSSESGSLLLKRKVAVTIHLYRIELEAETENLDELNLNYKHGQI